MSSWFFLEEIPNANVFLLTPWARALSSSFKDVFKCNLDISIIYENSTVNLYFKDDQWKKAGNNAFKKSLKDPEFLNNVNLKNKKLQQRQFEFCRKLQEIDLKAIPTDHLIEIYDKFIDYYGEAIAIGWIDMAMEFKNELFSTYLIKYLDKKAKGTAKSGSELFSYYSTPKRKTIGVIEEEASQEIIESIIENNLQKLFLEKSAEEIDKQIDYLNYGVGNLLSKHSKKYGWIFHMYIGPAWKRDDFIKKIQDGLRNPAKESEESEKIKLDLDRKHKKLLNIASEIVFNKDLRKNAIYLSCYVIEDLYKELSDRLRISSRELKNVLPWKLSDYIKKNKIDELKEEIERNSKVLLSFNKGKCEQKYGLYVDGFLNEIPEEEISDDVKGTCAFPGVVKGKVKIINVVEDMEKMKQGDILVAHQTNPDLVLAMKKAGAIVTDLGGITCHAAIVSREIKKPCVVGTGNASKVLNDGDEIVVDATKGMIKTYGGDIMFTKNFTELTKDDVTVAGGKGASLGEMTQAGIPVPPGLVILSSAFEKYIGDNNLAGKIDSILKTVDYNNNSKLNEASERIKKLIMSGKVSKQIESQIFEGFKGMNAKFVAVRSSATAEDSSEAAWAGQLESYLNTTEITLLENVKKCWASLFTPRAIFYRFEQKLDKQKISVAVVVQKMINSDVSGVAFSVHPVTKKQNELLIEACFGLGEAIVSGQVTPDSYVIEKDEWLIQNIALAEQKQALVRQKLGGNLWKSIKNTYLQKIGGKRIVELAQLIGRIEDHYGFPCDIEWAMEDGEFFITQSRPITTLK